MTPSTRTIVLSDGGLTSLLACAHAAEAVGITTSEKQPAAMMPFRCGTDQSRLKAALLQAELLGLERLDPAPSLAPPAQSFGEEESRELLNAVYAAARHSAVSVVWPIQCSRGDQPDLDWIARAADRAVLVSRLVSLDVNEHGVPGIRIETPYIDMNDDQIAELAAELDLPLRACWWSVAGQKNQRAMEEKARWNAAMQRIGFGGAFLTA